MNSQTRIRVILLGLLLATVSAVAPAQQKNLKQLLNFRGQWKFEIGDDMKRASVVFPDGNWDVVTAPSPWEDQGYPGYDGYAWYRKHFSVPAQWKGKALYVRLGYVDDVDEVYVNGQIIGFQGQFPPQYVTAYNLPREYLLPVDILNFSGDNVIAVRVFDNELSGGIMGGDLGIYEDFNAIVPEVPLADEWKLSTGDNSRWADPGFDDRSWKTARVPAYWETQGLKGYDGFGWYRTSFRVSADFAGQTMVLLLGRIDDFDEAYLNGELVGKTGRMPPGGDVSPGSSDEYLIVRAYTIPAGQLHSDRDNVIAVRVYDGFLHGGIYEGPIGLATRDTYRAWTRLQRDPKGFLDRMFEFFSR
jgi:sialate O-acetylesterase